MKLFSALGLLLLASNAEARRGSRGRSSRGRTFTHSTETTTTTSSSSSSSNFDECLTSTSDDHILQCSGHVGTVYGDPHITTFDGYATSCQAQGEFVLTESAGEIETQARFKRFGDVSVTSGIAASVPGTPTIQVSFAEYDSGSSSTIDICSNCDMHLYIGGVLQDANIGSVFSDTGYTVTVNSGSVDVQYFDGSTPTSAFTIQPNYSKNKNFCYMTVYFCLTSSNSNLLDNAVGLLGTPNRDCTDDFMSSTGTIVDEPTSSTEKFDYCTTYFCVANEGDSLFVHEDAFGGMSFEEYEGCSDAPPEEVDTSDIPDDVLEICGEDNPECILDGIVFGPEDADRTVTTQDTTIAITVSTDVVDTTPDTTCPYDIVWLDTVGSVDFDQYPLSIVSQDGTSAVLKVQSSSFAEVDIQYVEYEEDYVVKCISETDVTTSYTEEITVTCPGSEGVTLVHVVASDDALDPSVDTAEPSECCHADGDTNGKVKFTFMVSCVPQCPEDTV